MTRRGQPAGAELSGRPREQSAGAEPLDAAPGRRKRDRLLVAVAALRFVVPLAAVPLIPVLIPDHVAWMLLLRPTKEFQLIGGAQYQLSGAPHPLLLLAAFVPFMVVAIWAFFAVGRMERDALAAGTAPRWLQRALPERQLAVAQALLAHRGATIALLGRLGGLPPTVLAAAAGASDIPARRYLAADAAGALLSFAVMVRVGMGAGRAWEEGVGWLTAVTAVLFVTVLVILAWWIRAEARDYDASHPAVDLAADPT
jgi:membrane protein DedA with SNARE-associated domain